MINQSKVIPIHPDVKTAPPPPAHWVFMDAGDTFIYGYPTFYEAIRDCWALGHSTPLEPDIIRQAVTDYMKTKPRQDLNNQDSFTRYFRTLYRGVMENLHYTGNLEEAVEYLWGQWESGHRLRLFDDARSALEDLQRGGFSLGVISNWDNTFDSVLRRLGVHEYFAIKLTSCSVGISKPDFAIFQRALDLAGVPANQVWYLGDQLHVDVVPAKTLGMRTIYVDYYGNGGGESLAEFVAPSMSVAARIILAQKIGS